MDLELKGKTAIVTGGSRGIGKAIARSLAGEGVDVAIVARSADALKLAADEIAEQTGQTIVPISADTGSDDSVKTMVEQAARALGHIDILVNCPAQPRAQRLGISTEEAEKRMVNNLVGRWIDASDIANVVTFLASPKAIAINGDVIAAGGGIPNNIYY